MKVWVVYDETTYFTEHGDLVTNRVLCRVFDSEDKAVKYIRERIDYDHEHMEYCELNFDRESYVRYDFNSQHIAEGYRIPSYEYCDDTVYYRYESISVG